MLNVELRLKLGDSYLWITLVLSELFGICQWTVPLDNLRGELEEQESEARKVRTSAGRVHGGREEGVVCRTRLFGAGEGLSEYKCEASGDAWPSLLACGMVVWAERVLGPESRSASRSETKASDLKVSVPAKEGPCSGSDGVVNLGEPDNQVAFQSLLRGTGTKLYRPWTPTE